MIDARRGEVFTAGPGGRPARRSSTVDGLRLVGDGAVRYRELFEAAGAEVPPDDDPAHLPGSPASRRARRRVRPRRGDRAPLPPRPRRGPGPMTALAIEIRPLGLSDLTAIDSIEQRAYRTPWSRSMFASELAKASSICLGAFEGDRLVGYVVNSRYVDAWHVMNVAVDPDLQRRGIATRLLERLFELTRDDQRRGYTLEVRVSNAEAIAPLREARLRPPGHPPRLLHRQPRRRADHVARPRAGRLSQACLLPSAPRGVSGDVPDVSARTSGPT